MIARDCYCIGNSDGARVEPPIALSSAAVIAVASDHDGDGGVRNSDLCSISDQSSGELIVMPVIATAFVTVTVPVVEPPMALSSAAVIAVESASLMVTVASETATFVPLVTKAAVT